MLPMSWTPAGHFPGPSLAPGHEAWLDSLLPLAHFPIARTPKPLPAPSHDEVRAPPPWFYLPKDVLSLSHLWSGCLKIPSLPRLSKMPHSDGLEHDV